MHQEDTFEFAALPGQPQTIGICSLQSERSGQAIPSPMVLAVLLFWGGWSGQFVRGMCGTGRRISRPWKRRAGLSRRHACWPRGDLAGELVLTGLTFLRACRVVRRTEGISHEHTLGFGVASGGRAVRRRGRGGHLSWHTEFACPTSGAGGACSPDGGCRCDAVDGCASACSGRARSRRARSGGDSIGQDCSGRDSSDRDGFGAGAERCFSIAGAASAQDGFSGTCGVNQAAPGNAGGGVHAAAGLCGGAGRS
jgi:hypothetical protein